MLGTFVWFGVCSSVKTGLGTFQVLCARNATKAVVHLDNSLLVLEGKLFTNSFGRHPKYIVVPKP